MNEMTLFVTRTVVGSLYVAIIAATSHKEALALVNAAMPGKLWNVTEYPKFNIRIDADKPQIIDSL